MKIPEDVEFFAPFFLVWWDPTWRKSTNHDHKIISIQFSAEFTAVDQSLPMLPPDWYWSYPYTYYL